jgi:16S rRNA (cytosine967-C5)-methyltransferase
VANSQPSPGRRIAFEILQRVAAGAHASELLVELAAPLDSRDAGLAAEVTLGVLRRQGQLDFLIEQTSGRPLAKLDPEVAIALRMALYQVRFLDRVPAYAAVNDSLNLLRAAKKTSAVGFANAVLRKAGREAGANPRRSFPVDLAVPEWLYSKWARDFGAKAAHSIALASLEVPRLYQNVPPAEDPPAGARPTSVPGCWEVDSPDPRYRVQDIGSQAIVPLLEIEPGSRVLDICAAPGNKTAQALQATPRVLAADMSLQRLKSLKPLGIPLVAMDATEPFPFGAPFDRILVDAPCSGTGTLAHNPEIKWRLAPHDFARFAARQEKILRQALEALAPGGLLVYSTCSLEPEENEQVAHRVAGGRIQREIRRMPGRAAGDGFYAAVIRSPP